MSSVITVENLSKKYIIGHQQQERYTALRDVLANGAKRFAHKLTHPFAVPNNDPTQEEFWALKDVSFDIQQGDRVGIIGRNGAGKSTLLKILSRITEPTSGKISIKGRVASLLEVGTGFHPELTGRENIYLNGAILGMSKIEIKSKFDEIVAFAEVEKFLDTPVKRYSSGMYVRLAFAVAAHLELDILIVDEVLAVGDASFQKKCLGKMEEVGKEGRTVVFVSHNMGALVNLCDRALLIETGRLKYTGSVSDTIREYQGNIKNSAFVELNGFSGERRGAQEFAKFSSISVCEKNGQPCDLFNMGDTLVIRLHVHFKKTVKQPRIGVMLRNTMGVLIHDFVSAFDGFFVDIEPGQHIFEITVPEIKVYPGTYTLGPWIQQQVGIASDDYIGAALKITIIDRMIIGHSEARFETISKEGSETYHSCQWRKIR